MDIKALDVDLGDVEVFEPEDYEDLDRRSL